VTQDWQNEKTRRAKAAQIDTTVPNAARVADYLYGGRDNFEADRRAVRAMVATAPVVGAIVAAAHAFHRRVVDYLVAQAGIRQFLNMGGSLGASGSTHEIAQAVDPGCRVVYVDSDPVMLSHARALMKSGPSGVTSFLDADVREPHVIVARAGETLDFGQPIAVMLLSTSPLSQIADTAAAAAVVSALMATTASGSYVALHHQASDLDVALPSAIRRWNQVSHQPITLRSRAEIASLVAGLEPVPPGLVPIADWHPSDADPPSPDVVPVYGVVARKP
jgi:hypothetical protein